MNTKSKLRRPISAQNLQARPCSSYSSWKHRAHVWLPSQRTAGRAKRVCFCCRNSARASFLSTTPTAALSPCPNHSTSGMAAACWPCMPSISQSHRSWDATSCRLSLAAQAPTNTSARARSPRHLGSSCSGFSRNTLCRRQWSRQTGSRCPSCSTSSATPATNACQSAASSRSTTCS